MHLSQWFQIRNIIPGIPHNDRHAVFFEELKIRQVHRQTIPWLNWSRERSLRFKTGRGEVYIVDIYVFFEKLSMDTTKETQPCFWFCTKWCHIHHWTAELVDLVRLYHRSHTGPYSKSSSPQHFVAQALLERPETHQKLEGNASDAGKNAAWITWFIKTLVCKHIHINYICKFEKTSCIFLGKTMDDKMRWFTKFLLQTNTTQTSILVNIFLDKLCRTILLVHPGHVPRFCMDFRQEFFIIG